MGDNIGPRNSNPPPLPQHHLYATPHYYLSHQHSENPNSHLPIPGIDQGLTPPGVHPNSSAASLAQSHGGLHVPYDPSVAYAQSAYYQDPNVANSLKNWATEVLQYYGSIPNAAGVTIPTIPSNATVWPRGNSTGKKSTKKIKIIQSVWCEVCRIECNTKEVLDKHKAGKKHKKNVEKLKDTNAPPPPVSSGVSVNPLIGLPENPATSATQNTRKKAAEPAEDLETKRRKIVEEGAASDAVRVCTICNVVCNSELVFAYHNAGKKHASMMTKNRISGTGVTAATAS